MATINGDGIREGVASILDTDLYKLTMQCAVLKHFPKDHVAYNFTNRTPHMKFNRAAFTWLQNQVKILADISATDDEIEWLRTTCPYLGKDYLEYLKQYRFKPAEQVDLSFNPVSGSPAGDGQLGEVSIHVRGLWVETILYEIPLLSLCSEAYFKFVDKDWHHDGQVEKARHKGLQFLEGGCSFSEFGSRRRRDYHTHDLVMQGLMYAKENGERKAWRGKFTGTSNVHFAKKYGVPPIGTVAHEWFMGIAALSGKYDHANEEALRRWTLTFGRGVLAIALTDTFGTPSFLKAFVKPAPKDGDSDSNTEDWKGDSYAKIFTGVRQDSGNPLDFIQMMRTFYDTRGIKEPKTIVFSDSLTVERCIEYKKATEAAGLTPAFGVGTYFTNDFWHLSVNDKSVPMNIVIKLAEVNGKSTVKLSDDKGKNMGPAQLVDEVKHDLGYTDKEWVEGDEAHRWDEAAPGLGQG